MQAVQAQRAWEWEYGPVDRRGEHFVLAYGPIGSAWRVAAVGPPRGRRFPVELLDDHGAGPPDLAAALSEVERQLDFHLLEAGGLDPWGYAKHHAGTQANAQSRLHWLWRARTRAADEDELFPLVDEAWSLYTDSLLFSDTATVRPSMPILYFGDAGAYAASPLRILTVGLNPSHEEFPDEDPWLRFPTARLLQRRLELDVAGRIVYLRALNEYFRGAPYRRWFDRSFEPLLQGAGASYYDDSGSVALHTHIASPVATDPTWGKLGSRRAQHDGGAALWVKLAGALAPHVVILSVARPQLAVFDRLLVGPDGWTELFRIERERPFVVQQAQAVLEGRRVLLVAGRATNVSSGRVSYAVRARIGKAIVERVAELGKALPP